ncbi:MAG: radical SAM protein [Clostridia bacterium]|nr:radical SAM protein [Clostridia bacterium]
MLKKYKMSKYNYTVRDNEGNLILYNFLIGLKSLVEVDRFDVDEFERLFLNGAVVEQSTCEKQSEIVKRLISMGILVDADIDESIYCDSCAYEDIYSNELVLTILPTGKCNFKCPYCFELDKPFHRAKMTLENQKALLKFVQKRVSKHKSLKVGWFGGEPLLEPDVIRNLSEGFMSICKARFLPYSSEMTTNGYFLNEEIFDMLYKCKIYNYQVTIDGLKERHDKSRMTKKGEGTFDQIVSNLLRIKREKRYKFARILIRVNVTEDLMEELNEFIDFISLNFCDDPRFNVTFMPVADFSEKSKPSLENKKVTAERLTIALSDNSTYMKRIFDEKNARVESLLPKRKCVAAMKNTYVVTPDLAVYKCCIYFEHPLNKIGYINLDGDLIIDDIKHRQWFTQNKLYESCNDCFYLPVCKSTACPIRMFSETKAPFCSLKNEEFYRKLSENIVHASKICECTKLNLEKKGSDIT